MFVRLSKSLLFFAAVSLLLIAARPLQVDPDFTDLAGVLAWLAGVGGPYFAGWVLSLLAENWPKWHDLPKAVKVLTPLVLSALVAVLSTLALQQAELVELVSPWYTLIAGSVLGYLGTQQAYLSAKRAGYGAKV